MILTHKTECYPSIKQIKQIEINFGIRRFFFNKTIRILKHKYGDLKENKKLITKKEVMTYRKEIFRSKYRELTKLAPSHILDTAMEDVMFALNSLWKKGKEINLRKKKYSNTCRWGSSSPAGSFFKHGKYLQIPRLGKLKMAEEIRFDLDTNKSIRCVTIKKEAGRYFISITCEVNDKPKTPNLNRHLGIDWGIKTYITAFDGTDIYEDDFDPDKLKKLDRSIAIRNKSLSRKVRFSQNWLKAKTKLGQAHLDFANYRHDAINKMVKIIDNAFDSVTLENLGMKFVTSNRNLAKKAAQKPFYLLKAKLINKFNQTGKKVYLVPKTFPSTQTCNSCGNIKTGKDKMKLGQHLYECDCCGNIDDRDHNAAKNLYSYKNLEEASLEN